MKPQIHSPQFSDSRPKRSGGILWLLLIAYLVWTTHPSALMAALRTLDSVLAVPGVLILFLFPSYLVWRLVHSRALKIAWWSLLIVVGLAMTTTAILGL